MTTSTAIGSSGAIPELLHAGGLGAVRAAIDAPVLLDAVADDAAIAVGARRREGLDGALEAVERVRGASHRDLEGLVVLVSAHLTASGGHRRPPCEWTRGALVGTSLALGHLPHRLRRAQTLLDLGYVGKADHADQPAVLVGDDHARLLALSHELLRVRDVVVGTASDDFRSHDVGGGRGRRPTLCDDADAEVTVGDRAQHLLARVADRQEPDLRIAH